MPAALLKLIWLQGRGVARRGVRGAGSPRRAVLLVLGVFVLILWIGPSIFAAVKMPHSDRERVRAITPVALLGICVLTVVTSVGDKAISFTPGEVDLLFGAPFSRRQLLGYKLLKSALGATLTALVLSVVLLRHAQWWPACYLGLFLTLLFVQFFSINAVLAAQSFGARVHGKVQLVAVLIGLSIVALFARHAASFGNAEMALAQLRQAPVARVVLTPLSAFGDAITAKSVAEFASPAALAVLLDAVLLALVILLDAQYIEAALAASQRRAHLARIRSGSMLSIGRANAPRWRAPRLPWAGGAGPIAWRQATLAARSSGGLVLLLLIVAIGATPAFVAGARSERFGMTLIGVLAWLTFLVTNMIKFDFRGDVDQMDTLKALPIAPVAVAAGQVVVPVLMLTVVHVALLLLAASLMPAGRMPLLCAAALSLPFNALLFAIENLTFLLYPTRPAAVSPGDFQVLGRQVVVLAVKLVALVAGCIIPFSLGVFAYVLSGASIPVGAAVAWVLLSAEAVAVVPAIAWAYRRFDPSADTPV